MDVFNVPADTDIAIPVTIGSLFIPGITSAKVVPMLLVAAITVTSVIEDSLPTAVVITCPVRATA